MTNLIVYNSRLIFDGKEFIDICNFDFKSKAIVVFNVKELFTIFIEKKIKFDMGLIYGLEYMNTSLDVNFGHLSAYRKVETILDIQTQNLERSYDFIPDNFLKKMMNEQHEYLQDKIKGKQLNYLANKYPNTVSHSFAKIEQKSNIPINFKVYGTITGRVMHEYVSKNKEFIKKKLGSDIYEFDFKAFEISNMRTFLGMPYVADPYSIENVDREIVKLIMISKLYGMSDSNIIKKHGEQAKLALLKITEEYKPLFEFKNKLVQEAKQNGCISLPISDLKIHYQEEEKIDNKVVNNFFQGLSADVMKLKLFRLYRQYKKSKTVIILFPVHDSYYIRVKDKAEIPNIINNLEEPLTVKDFTFKNKVETTAL